MHPSEVSRYLLAVLHVFCYCHCSDEQPRLLARTDSCETGRIELIQIVLPTSDTNQHESSQDAYHLKENKKKKHRPDITLVTTISWKWNHLRARSLAQSLLPIGTDSTSRLLVAERKVETSLAGHFKCITITAICTTAIRDVGLVCP